MDPLKYQQPAAPTNDSGELMTVKLRYKPHDGDVSRLLEYPIVDTGMTLDEASPDFHFASAVASFGMLLRHSQHAGTATFATVLDLAAAGLGDEDEYRTEFLDLVHRAAQLTPQ